MDSLKRQYYSKRWLARQSKLGEPRRIHLIKRECGFETKTEKGYIIALVCALQKEINYLSKEYY
jgi:hypothetical protein